MLLGLATVLFDGSSAGVPPVSSLECLQAAIAGKPAQILGIVTKLACQLRQREIIFLLRGGGGRAGLQVEVKTRLHCLADEVHERAILASVGFVQAMNVANPPIFKH